ncbi:MAG: T9SS type A sorting domain-containing protein, partial [Candidatus Cloacimonetes bacterium]|nr:T9SS type A sorting domain-containing protein [Candidatus Cloacimonadota bacterium]
SVAGGILVQYDLATGFETGVVFDVGTLVGSVGSAGGMFIADGIVPGFSTIGCMVQNEFIVGLELSPGDEPWITVTPLTGTVPAGESVVVDVTLDAADLSDITKTADLVIANNAGDDVIVDVTMIVLEDPIPVFDPPTNVEVDDVLGIVTWDPPAVSGVIIEDNFDSYTVGDHLAEVSDDWTTWSGGPGGSEDGVISDAQALSPLNSLLIEGSNDQLLIMDDYTSGVYTMELDLYIPSGFCGYWNLQKTSTPGTEWGIQIMFDVTGEATVDAGTAAAAIFNFNFDTWIHQKVIVDLDNDLATYYTDGVEIIQYQWTLGTGSGSIPAFGGLNLYAWASTGNSPQCYFDNVVLSSGTTRDLTGYNVYLDGDLISSVGTDIFDYTYEDLVFEQDYVAGISADYDGEESEIVEVAFEYQGVDAGNVIIAATKLNGNYPNPFNPITTIAYSIRETGKVTLQVYNIKGQLVKTLVNDVRETGEYTVTWNGRDNSNKTVASGVYFYKMKAQNYNNTKKMILMK